MENIGMFETQNWPAHFCTILFILLHRQCQRKKTKNIEKNRHWALTQVGSTLDNELWGSVCTGPLSLSSPIPWLIYTQTNISLGQIWVQCLPEWTLHLCPSSVLTMSRLWEQIRSYNSGTSIHGDDDHDYNDNDDNNNDNMVIIKSWW